MTTDRLGSRDFDQLPDPESIASPVANVVVELQPKGLTRFAQSDKNGRFVFDRLPEGELPGVRLLRRTLLNHSTSY